MKNDPLVSIGFMASRTGVAVSAIRYYESENLIPAVRSPSGQRLFPRSAIRRVSFILISQQLGYSLEQIKAALNKLPDNRTPTKADWDKLATSFSRDLDERIQKLQNLRDSLSGCIGCGCLSLQRCRLYNPDDKINKRGAGARYLLGDDNSMCDET
ncbi:MAG: redox-sensitive transcriptional activator SoxR [Proteobacteria bacterium]|nr:redox-sensitive transcriptional activator SoxR [Pseudomonadota bacterium]